MLEFLIGSSIRNFVILISAGPLRSVTGTPMILVLSFVSAASKVGFLATQHEQMQISRLLASVILNLGEGLIIGFSIIALLSSLEICGAIVDSLRGAQMAQIVSTASAESSTILSNFMSIFALCLFLYSGFLSSALSSSLVCSELEFTNWRWMALFSADSITRALGLSAPILIISFAADISSGILSKLVPGFSATFEFLPIKLFLGLVGLVISLSDFKLGALDVC